ncbi:MAG: sensor histidine kinase [Elainellaceae cyanobacterium]
MRSFRLRIALLVTAMAGVALVGFSGVAWRLIYSAKVSRVDVRMEDLFRGLARASVLPKISQPGPDRLLQRLEDEGIIVQISDVQGNPIYESENWSPAFAPVYPRRGGRRGRRWDRGDRLRSTTPALAPEGEPSLNQRFIPEGRQPPKLRIITRRLASGRWRVSAVRLPSRRIAIAISLQTVDQEMAAIRSIFLIAIPGTLLVVAAGAWGLSGSALAPIRRLSRTMQQITVAGLGQRVPVGTTDVEFAALIQVFNQMLERLERSFRQASRFSADAAHELKTPLAILQGELEQTLQRAEPGSPMQQQLSSLLDEVRRLSGIVRKLLLLSLADAGQMGLHKTRIDLSALLAVMLEDCELLAPHLKVTADIAPGLVVWGDRDLLTQVVQNLISNAIKYNLPQGWVSLEAQQSVLEHRTTVQVTLTNASRPIPPQERDRIFDRFYRGDPARTRTVEGLGLGLSLSREIVQAHGGRLALGTDAGEQTTFILTLPTAESPGQPQDRVS